MCIIIKFSLKIHIVSPLCSVVDIWLASPSNLRLWSKEMKRLVQDQRMWRSCWESRLLIKVWALDTKQLDLVPRLHNVFLSRFVLTSVATDGTCHWVLRHSWEAPRSKTQEECRRNLEAPANKRHVLAASGVGWNQRAVCYFKSPLCIYVFKQRSELVYLKIKTWCQATAVTLASACPRYSSSFI